MITAQTQTIPPPLAPSVAIRGHAHVCSWCGGLFLCEQIGYAFTPLCQLKCQTCRYQENFA